jgi:hypothetical protein
VPVAVVAILAGSFTPEPVLVTGLVLAGLIAASVIVYADPAPATPPAVAGAGRPAPPGRDRR